MWGTQEQIEVEKAMIAAFQVKHPNITVKLEPFTAADYFECIEAMFKDGSSPDVLGVEIGPYAMWIEKGMLENLTPYLQRDNFDWSDFFPEAKDAFTYEGNIYGLPRDVSGVVLAYNQDLFDAAYIRYPPTSWDSSEWTWDDFLNACRSLTDASGSQFGFVLSYYEPFVWSNGGDIFDDEKAPTACVIDRPEAVEALQWLADLRFKHHVVPLPEEQGEQGALEMFASGKIGMVLIGRWDVPWLRERANFRWNAALIPAGKAGRVTLRGGTALGISTQSKHRDAAWEFIRFATSSEGIAFTARGGRTTPARKSVANSDIFLKPGPPTNNQVFLDTIANSRRPAISPVFVECQREIAIGLEPLWLGKRSAQECADAIKPKVAQILRRE